MQRGAHLSRWLLNGAIGAGVVLALWPLGQYGYGRWSQRQLAAQWLAASQAAPTSTPTRSGVHTEPASGFSQTQAGGGPEPAPGIKRAASRPGKLPKTVEGHGVLPAVARRPGWPLTKIRIPDIDLVAYVVQGQDPAALRRGPGHDEASALPGEGNCVIAGHRNIFGSPFLRLDELQPGAQVFLDTPGQAYVYTLQRSIATPDSNLSVLDSPPAGSPPRLTLITCTLPHTNDRIVLQCDLNQ